MTAEIAILNRIGVALAADSAVSIGRGNGEEKVKVYNSVDKLFALTNSEPVGVMINGTPEYLNVPAETIIKSFRQSKYADPQASVRDYAKAFFSYLHATFGAEPDAVLSSAATILSRRLLRISEKAAAILQDPFRRAPKDKSMAKLFTESVVAELRLGLRQARAFKKLPEIEACHLPPALDALAREAIVLALGSNFLFLEEEVTELITLLLTRDIPTGNDIKFVFAGFGTEQIYPSIYCADCDAPLIGMNKIRPVADEEVSSQPAIIMPFAQKEMVERFMDGVDSHYSAFIESAMDKALERMAEFTTTECHVEKPSKAVRNNLARMRIAFMDEIRKSAEAYRISAFRESVLEIVQFMPKSELAEMAESLVNLTSIKRRVSAQQETVGGPIDVAVISKNDGFVWIKRKHYFSRDLNHRYFANQDRKMAVGVT